MLSQTDAVKQAWAAADRTLDIIVTVDGKDYQATEINSLNYDAGAFTGDTLGIGSTYENSVTIEFSSVVEAFKQGLTILPRVGILVNDKFEYTKLGTFIISEVNRDRNNNLTTIKALDQMCKLEGQYTPKVGANAKPLDVIADIANQGGVTVNEGELQHLPSLPNLTKTIDGQTLRTAIGWIAQLYGGFATFDRDGKLTIRTTATPDYTISPSEYQQGGLTKNEVAYQTGGIKVTVNNKTTDSTGQETDSTQTLQAGATTGSQIELTNNVMTEQALATVWNGIKDITYYPYTLNWFGNPGIEAGDWVTLTDTQGNQFNVPVNQCTMSFNGGLESTISATQSSSTAGGYAYTGSAGSIKNMIEALQVRHTASGNNVYPPSYQGQPQNPKKGDVWYKQNGNNVEVWIYQEDDGKLSWVRTPLDGEVKAELQAMGKKTDEDLTRVKSELSSEAESQWRSAKTATSETDQRLTSLQAENNKSLADLHDTADSLHAAANSLHADADSMRSSLTAATSEVGNDLANARNSLAAVDADLRNGISKASNDLANAETSLAATGNSLATATSELQRKTGQLSGSLSTADSMIMFNSSAIAEVKRTAGEISTTVSNIRVGDRNLARGVAGGKDWFVFQGFNGLTNYYQDLVAYQLDTLKAGDTVTFGITMKNEGVTSGTMFFQQYGDVSQWNRDFGGISSSGNVTDFVPDGAERALTYTIPITAGMLNGNSIYTINIRTDNVPAGGKLSFRYAFVKKGTMATDWTPAPEDTDQAISKISQTADTIRADLTNTQGDVASVKATASSLTTSMANANDQISTLQHRADSITSTLSNGGVNLLSGTMDFSWLLIPWALSGTKNQANTYNDSERVTEHKCVMAPDTVQGIFWGGNNTVGQTYTLSFDARCDNGKAKIFQMGLEGNFLVDAALTTNWVRYHVSGKVTAGNHNWVTYFSTTAADNVYVRKYQIEYGDTATPWQPSNGDISSLQQTAGELTSRMSNAEGNVSGLQQTAKSIQSSVTNAQGEISNVKQTANKLQSDLANAKGDISSLQQTASGLQSTVAGQDGKISQLQHDADGLKLTAIGGGNLLNNTSGTLQSFTVDNWVWYVVSADEPVAKHQVDGQTVTLSAWIENPSKEAWVQMYTDTGTAQGNRIPAGGSGWSQVTYTMPSGFNYWNIVIGCGDGSGTITLSSSSLQLELGPNRTAWSQSTADITQLKITADGISADLTNAKHDIASVKAKADSLTSSMTNANNQISTLQQRADSITSTLSNGGVNLLSGTMDFSWLLIPWALSGTKNQANTYNDSERVTEHKCVMAPDTVQGIFWGGNNTVGQTYTLSFDARCDNGKAKIFQMGLEGNFLVDAALTTNWVRYHVSGKVTAGNHNWVTYFSTTAADNVYVRKYQIEYGETATPWNQSSGDISALAQTASSLTADLTNAKNDIASVNVKADSLTSSMANANDQISTLQHRADSITSTLSNGGRNLLSNTREMNDPSIWGNLGAWAKGDFYNDGINKCQIVQTNNIQWNGLKQYVFVEAGKKYTFSIDAKSGDNSNHTAIFYIPLNNAQEGPYNRAEAIGNDQKFTYTPTWTRYSFTITATTNGYVAPRIERGTTTNELLQLARPQFEYGETATPWQPSNGDISSLQQTASSLTADMKDAKGNISSLQVTAGGLNTRVTNAEHNVSSLQETADRLSGVVGDANSGLVSSVNAIPGQISSAITASKQAAVIASAVDLHNMKTAGYYLLKGTLTNSPVTAWAFLRVISSDSGDRIYHRIWKDNESVVYTEEWTGNWSGWTTHINSDNLKSNVITAINQSTEGVSITGSKITLDGNVNVAPGFTLSADRIKAGTLSADRISGGTLNFNNINAVNINANDITTGTMTADHIKGGTLDFSNVNVKNINANSITAGVIRGNGNWFNLETGYIESQGQYGESLMGNGSIQLKGTDIITTAKSTMEIIPKQITIDGNIYNRQWQAYYSNTGFQVQTNDNAYAISAGFLPSPTGASGRISVTSNNDFSIIDAGSISTTGSVLAGNPQGILSRLSQKRNIEPVAPAEAVKAIMGTDMYAYNYLRDLEDDGKESQRYISLIIDDVNDKPKYNADPMLVSNDRKYRYDANLLGYHHVALQSLIKEVGALKARIKELERTKHD